VQLYHRVPCLYGLGRVYYDLEIVLTGADSKGNKTIPATRNKIRELFPKGGLIT